MPPEIPSTPNSINSTFATRLMNSMNGGGGGAKEKRWIQIQKAFYRESTKSLPARKHFYVPLKAQLKEK